jgi:hypothetical protein
VGLSAHLQRMRSMVIDHFMALVELRNVNRAIDTPPKSVIFIREVSYPCSGHPPSWAARLQRARLVASPRPVGRGTVAGGR